MNTFAFQSRIAYWLAGLAVLTLLLAACGDQDATDGDLGASPEDAEEGADIPEGIEVDEEVRGTSIVVYSPFPDEEMIELIEPFEEMTDITVDNLVISTGEAQSRIAAEAENPQADVWLSMRPALLKAALDDGLVEDYEPATADQVSDDYVFPDDSFLTGVGMYPLVFFYNEEAIDREGIDIPTTYEELLDDQYEGQIVMPHPAASGTAYAAVTLFLDMYGDDQGWEYMSGLSANVDQFTRGGRAPQNLVAQGEYPLGIGFYDAVYFLQEEGFPIEAVYPEPIFGEPYSTQVVADAPNPEGARLFYDYLLTEEAQEVLTRYGNYSVREDVDPPEGAVALSELDIFDYNWEQWADQDPVLEEFERITGVAEEDASEAGAD